MEPSINLNSDIVLTQNANFSKKITSIKNLKLNLWQKMEN